MDTRPIGVFDSGLGGLTVVKKLREVLPHEDIVYFGDTGRVPYGTKGRETILRYARQDMQLLLNHDVKLIVAACGTVSSFVTEELTRRLPVPFLSVLAPAAQKAAALSSTGRIGVLGTSATVPQQKLWKSHSGHPRRRGDAGQGLPHVCAVGGKRLYPRPPHGLAHSPRSIWKA